MQADFLSSNTRLNYFFKYFLRYFSATSFAMSNLSINFATVSFSVNPISLHFLMSSSIEEVERISTSLSLDTESLVRLSWTSSLRIVRRQRNVQVEDFMYAVLQIVEDSSSIRMDFLSIISQSSLTMETAQLTRHTSTNLLP